MSAVVAVLAVLLVLAALLVWAEREARRRLQEKLMRMCADVLGAPPEVTLDRRPVLLQLLQRRLSRVGIDTVSTDAGPRSILVHGDARGVAQVPEGLRLSELTATATLRLSWIRHVVEVAQAGAGANGVTVRSITLLPKKKSLAMTVGLPVAFGLGVDLRVVILVGLKDGRLTFRATELAMPVSIVPVPIPVAWAIDSWIVQLRPKVIPAALDALTIRAIRWEKKSVTLDLTADDATVPLTA